MIPSGADLPARPSEGGAPETGGLTLLKLASVILAGRRQVLVVALAVLGIAFFRVIRREPVYRASSTLLVASSSEASSAAQIRGLASQLGVNTPPASRGSDLAPELVVRLAISPVLLRDLAFDSLEVPELGSGKRPLGALIGLTVPPPATGPERERYLRDLTETMGLMLMATADRRTGAISLSAASPWPALALHLVQRTTQELDQYLFELRKRRASAERVTLEERLTAQQGRLRQEEAKLGAFLERNRLYTASPELRFEYERLQRGVALQQQVLLAIAQGREETISREIQAAPMLTVLEPPLLPIDPEPRGRVRTMIQALIAGVVLGMFWVLVANALRHAMARQTREVQVFRAQLLALRPRRTTSESSTPRS